MLGVVSLSVWNVGGWITAQRLRFVGVSPVEPDIAERISELVHRMKVSRPVRLLRSAVVKTPITIGWLRPTILLPLGLITGLTPSELDAIITHELAHIRRHDYPVNLLQTVIETLLFYHPAVWWVSRRIRIERENCCDDWAVAVTGDSLSYARTLTRFGELRHADERRLSVGQSVSADGGSLLARVRRLVPRRGDDNARPRTWLAGGVVLATAALLAVVIGYVSPPTRVANSATAADISPESMTVQLKKETWRNRWERIFVSFRLSTPASEIRLMALDIDSQGKAVAQIWEPRKGKSVRYESTLARDELDALARRLGQQRPWELHDTAKLPGPADGTIAVSITVEGESVDIQQPWPPPKDLRPTRENEQLVSALMAMRAAMTHVIEVVRRDAAIRASRGDAKDTSNSGEKSAMKSGDERTAVRRVLDLLDLPWQTKLTAKELDEAAASIRDEADQAVEAIMKRYNETNNNSFRHRAVQIFERLGTAKAQDALLDIALGRTAAELPGSHAWAARAYIEVIPDKADARELLASRESAVLNPALLALRGVPVDAALLKRIREIVERQEKDAANWLGLRVSTANVVSSDTRAVLLSERVELLVTMLSGVAQMPDRDKIGYHSSMTHGERAYRALLNALRDMPAEARPILEEASDQERGIVRELLVIARADRGDSAVRKDIHRILADAQAGLRRAWAARALSVIGTAEDLPLLRRLAETDAMSRGRGGDVGPPGFRDAKFYPVRDAAKDAIQALEAKVAPATNQAATTPLATRLVQTGKASFDTLAVKKTSTWRWDHTLTVRGDGTYVFDLELLGENHLLSGKHYVARYRLHTEHLRRLEELLRATDWLTKPGKVDPYLEDGTKYALTLDRGGPKTTTVCYGDQEKAYKDLIQFFRRIDAQEWLLYQMTPDARYRSNPVAQLDNELDAVLGNEPGKTPPYAPVLDYKRLLPALESLLARGTWKEQKQIQGVIRKINEWRKRRPATPENRKPIQSVPSPVETGFKQALPGSRLSIAEAVNRWTAFAVACEATKEPKDAEFAHIVPGSARKWHQYRTDVVIGGGRGPAGHPILGYRVWETGKQHERPIAKGEQVIWIGDNPAPDLYQGVKALPNTPENRETVRAAFAKRPASANKYVAFPEYADAEQAAQRVSLLKRNLGTFRFVFRAMLLPDKRRRFVALRVSQGKDSSPWEKPAIQITRQQATRIVDHLAAEGLFFRRAGNVIKNAAFEPEVNVHTIWLINNENDPEAVFVEQIQYGKDDRIRALRDVLEGDARDAVDELLSQLESTAQREDMDDNKSNSQDTVL